MNNTSVIKCRGISFVKNQNDKIKICIACSAGGHLTEVRSLAPVYQKYDHFYFTFSGGVANELKKTHKVCAIPNISRKNPLSWLPTIILSLYYVLKKRPDIIITTGAGIVVFFCIFSKLLFRTKIIFLESMATVDSPTLTARILYPFSDLFLIQWAKLEEFFPKAEYAGRVF